MSKIRLIIFHRQLTIYLPCDVLGAGRRVAEWCPSGNAYALSYLIRLWQTAQDHQGCHPPGQWKGFRIGWALVQVPLQPRALFSSLCSGLIAVQVFFFFHPLASACLWLTPCKRLCGHAGVSWQLELFSMKNIDMHAFCSFYLYKVRLDNYILSEVGCCTLQIFLWSWIKQKPSSW
jgi:hypothetical protein